MSGQPRLRSVVLASVLTTAIALALPASAIAAARVAPSPHAARPSALAAPRLPLGARVLGTLSPTTHLSVAVALEPRDPAELSAFAAAVSNRHSALFRHYLAKGQFAARFGPTAASIHAVERYFAAQGLAVGALAANHLMVTVSGSASSFERAFHTQLQSVRLRGGQLGRRTLGALRLPGTVAQRISAVVGLNELTKPQGLTAPVDQIRRPTQAGLGRSFTNHPHSIPGAPSACAAATATTKSIYGGITDDQVAQAYGVDGLYSAGDLGAGQTIAIYELEPFAMSDLQTFDRCYFGSDHSSLVKVIPVDGGAGVGPGSGEAILDVETVSALAPAAKIDVYEAPLTNYGYLDNYNAIVAADSAQVVSTSWGLCEQESVGGDPGQVAAENVLFEQAAVQGQTVFAAAGDDGNDDCANTPPQKPLISVDDPASQPYVVGVGGTTAISVTQPPAEQVWNDGDTGGAGGGGISTLWTALPWQRAAAAGKTNATACGATGGAVCRPVPDVSAFADEYTGVTIYYGSSVPNPYVTSGNYGEWVTIGGTSMAAPMWAAMLAEINASSACTGNVSTAKGVGYAAPLLYDVASNPTDYAAGFTDVTAGNNDLLNDEGGKYAASTGYDLASGLGSPELTAPEGVTGPGLADSLCAAAQGGTTATISSVTPSSGAVAGGTPFTIMGSGFYSSGTPDVRSVNFGTSSAASFTVVSNDEITGTTGADTDTASSTLSKLNARSGTVLVTVTTNDGSVARGPAYHYRAQSSSKDLPVLFQVGPTGGTALGGNKVNLYGTGFGSATKVTFGGVPATSFKVVSDTQILATPPADTHVQCAVADAKGLGICQTQVQVTGPGGKSGEATILKPYSGFVYSSGIGVFTVPKNCKCEAYPSVTEYDYVTKLSISKLATPAGGSYEADPYDGDLLTIDGTGFNILTVNWVDLGAPGQELNQLVGSIFDFSSTGTSLQLYTSGDPDPTDTGNSEPVVVDSVEGLSNSKSLSFGPDQQVNSVSDEVAPSAGGATLVVKGGGFVKVSEVAWYPEGLTGSPVDQYGDFTVNSKTQLTVTTPSLVPGSYEVLVCGQYGCGATTSLAGLSADTVSANYPGEAVVTSAELSGKQPTGSVAGGTTFEVQGTDFGPLGDVTVEFWNPYGEYVSSSTVTAGPAPTDPGATETIMVTSPPALAGDPDTDAVVVRGDDGTSPINAAALFAYTSP